MIDQSNVQEISSMSKVTVQGQAVLNINLLPPFVGPSSMV